MVENEDGWNFIMMTYEQETFEWTNINSDAKSSVRCSNCDDVAVHEKDQEKILDVANQRLELLRLRQKDTYDAVMWLRENKNQFCHHIYEPMMLEVRFTS
jgi:hypothetical protein